jgi:anti-sigma B factor antagonist
VDVRVRSQGPATLIEVQGEVDLYSSPKLREAIVGATKAKAAVLVVELSGVGYMDSSGVATLVEGLQFSRAYGGSFRVAGLTPSVQQVFQFAKLDRVFEIHPDATTALGASRTAG